MLKFLNGAMAAGVVLVMASPAFAADPAAGEKVFKKCAACHAVGDGAQNKVGPELNDLIGRTAGTADGYKYSPAMKKAGDGGLVWNEDTLSKFLADPRGFIKGTKMGFGGIKKEAELENVIAYLKTFSEGAGDQGSASDDTAAKAEPKGDASSEAASAPDAKAEPKGDAPADTASASDAKAEPKSDASSETASAASDAASEPGPADGGGAQPLREGGVLHLGRKATEDEVAAWNIDIRPDGTGLPEGSGTVAEGEPIYTDNCSGCHGVFGEGMGRWPVLAGGQGTLKADRPVKTVGSYWPYLSTVYDYVRRAMPFGNARSLSDDDVYALTAYILYLNDVVTDETFELSKDTFTSIHMPNEDGFIEDNRLEEPEYASKEEPCMENCKGGDVKITMRAQVLDVTPDSGDDENSGEGSIQ